MISFLINRNLLVTLALISLWLSSRRSIHGVTLETIERMLERFEHNVTLESILGIAEVKPEEVEALVGQEASATKK